MFDCNGLCLVCWCIIVDGFVIMGLEIGVVDFSGKMIV